MLSIRALQSDEAIIVREIAMKTWPLTFKEILSEEQISYMLNWMYSLELLKKQMDGTHSFFLAEWNRHAVGFLGMELNHPESGLAKIHKIYMLPSQQGQGIGKKLMEYSLDFAKKEGMNQVVLNVNRFNKAVNFYTYLGFTIDREEVIDIGNGYVMDDFVMRYNFV